VGRVWADVKDQSGGNLKNWDKPEFQGSFAYNFQYTCYSDRAQGITFE